MLGGAGAADGFGEIVGFAQGRASSPACREDSGGVGWRQSDGVEVHRAHPDARFSDSLCPGVVLREEGGEEEVPFHTRDLSTEESGIPVWRWDALKPIPCGFGGTTL